MPVPPNISASLATDISIPINNGQFYSITVPPGDLALVPGSLHTLWWTINVTTARQTSEFALGTPVAAVRTGSQAVWAPWISVWSGSPGSLVAYPPISTQTNMPVPINTPFLTLPFRVYIQVDVHIMSGTDLVDPLVFQVQPGPAQAAPKGSILITNFNPEWPAALIGTKGQFLQSAYLGACDFGAIMDDGTIAIINTNFASPPKVSIYDPHGSLVIDVAGLTTAYTFQQIYSDGTTNFYVAGSSLGTAAVVKTVNKVGTIGGTSWTLPANSKGIYGMAPNRAGTILYYQSFQGGAPTSEVFKYDLIGMAPLASLAAALAGYNPVKDLAIMADGNILVGYSKNSAGSDLIKRYNPAGTVLNTYTLPDDVALDRFTVGSDDPAGFVVFTFLISPPSTTARFLFYDTVSGSLLKVVDVPLYTDGSYTGGASNNPPRTGISNSCPILITRDSFPTPPGGTTGTTQAGFVNDPRITRRLRRAPHLSEEQFEVFYNKVRFDLEAGRGLAVGQGSTPLAMVRWSDDGGHNWSDELDLGAGPMGQFAYQMVRQSMGKARQRAYEITVSDPTAWNLIAAYLDADVGRG